MKSRLLDAKLTDGRYGDRRNRLSSPSLLRLIPSIMSALKGETLAVMVYGSQARGTANGDSDVDVLQVVPKGPRAYSHGRINVTGYMPGHIRQMSMEGSLFILHLRTEGHVLLDRGGILARALEMYRMPSDYRSLKHELAAAGSALDVSPEDWLVYGQALGRLGIYLLRTAAYIRCIELGLTTFDLRTVSIFLGMRRLNDIFSLRLRRVEIRQSDVAEMLGCLNDLLPSIKRNEHGSLAALAVSVSSAFPHAGNLLATILSGAIELDYAAMALPPL